MSNKNNNRHSDSQNQQADLGHRTELLVLYRAILGGFSFQGGLIKT